MPNVSRSDTQGLFVNAWDAAAFDTKKGEGQWECLGRIVRERAQAISHGINAEMFSSAVVTPGQRFGRWL
ncbi:MAG: hypothetical protein OEW18_07660 [Candidatus Aminicenantes bacterium]|nr:hypothetical protein [Candidatus Aminicenantes bacterium]